MATPAATKRLTKEYATISKNPPPYIVAHPSESNILEWHYILTGPPKTPYEGGQYWGTLVFPPNYPFAPPAIRMHTPSGRFQPSTRLCLSISDFHPKSFNPAWEVSTILIGLMSFMTSEEMTTGSVRVSDHDRRLFAARSRWWNSTGGGSNTSPPPPPSSGAARVGAIRAGDGGAKFRSEWPDLDTENWGWMRARGIDPATGLVVPGASDSGSGSGSGSSGVGGSGGSSGAGQNNGAAAGGAGNNNNCARDMVGLRRRPTGGTTGLGAAVVEGGQVARHAGQSWLGRNKFLVGAVVIFGYVILARILGEGNQGQAASSV
ncbi:ubiquitin-conjugating enzyme/RWD-like protein [Lineolata rhizophorae]|uniref:Ubiquitin-conjugating enzyme/RWD-like protein n=1 Tax=Lineolata rhizophorae TaxID=578093 RepID=A0A6A6P1T4_9PEZI|nr:ubiquitin-conjugating enzyme/RWD-like protein [Lineolata rhizophorae]